MISAGEFRNGVTFEQDGQVLQVVEFQHVKPGKGAAFVRTKTKNVITGSVVETSYNPTAKFPQASHRIDPGSQQGQHRPANASPLGRGGSASALTERVRPSIHLRHRPRILRLCPGAFADDNGFEPALRQQLHQRLRLRAELSIGKGPVALFAAR